MNRLNLENRINELIVHFVRLVKGSASMGRTDINKVGEITIAKFLFREICHYENLENMNFSEDDPNYPGIDLGDKIARVSMQVTATRKLEKVQKTLRQFIKHELYKEYNRVIVFILTEKQNSYSDVKIKNEIIQDIPFSFDTKKDIWDFRDFLKIIPNLDTEKLNTIKNFLEENIDGQRKSSLKPFVSFEDFFYIGLKENRLFKHTWNLEGRKNVLEKLHDFVKSSEKQVLILSGRGGIGKTKILYEFAKNFNYSDLQLWFVEESLSITSDNVNDFTQSLCLIVLDDAHRREQEIEILFHLINRQIRSQQPEIKLILSCRPHAIQFLESLLERDGIDYLKLDELKDLSSSEMKALAREALGQKYIHFAEQLAAIARDSPLVTVIGGQLLADRSIPLDLLERNEEFRRKVLSRFQDVLIGQVSNQIKPNVCSKILELIAAVSPIQINNEQFIQAATEFINIDRKTLIHNLGTLEEVGVLLRRGNNLRITPDVLADRILHRACLTEQGDSTGYAEEIFETFKEIFLAQVLRNLAELDWRIRSSSEQEIDLLDNIWQNLRDTFQQSSNLDRSILLKFIDKIAYYQPERSLDIVQFSIRNPVVTSEDENTSEYYQRTYSDVLSRLPAILKKISYTFDYLPICCDLLWQLGRDDPIRPRNNPPESIGILIGLAGYGINKPLQFNWKVLEAIKRWLQDSDVHTYLYSPLDILDPFFKKEIQFSSFDRKTITTSMRLVDPEKTREIRKEALKIIKKLLQSNNVSVTLRALESSKKALRFVHDRNNKPVQEINKQWELEQLEILEIIYSVVSSDIEPLIQLKTMAELNWFTKQTLSNAVQQKAKNIITSIPKTDKLKLTGTLINNYLWTSTVNALDTDWSESERFYNGITKELAEIFLKQYPLPYQGLQILNERLGIISANRTPVENRFLKSLSSLNPSYAIELCEQVLEIGYSPLAIHFCLMLYQARNFNNEKIIKIIQCAINSKNVSICQSFAQHYWVWQSEIDSELFYELIQKLLSHPHSEVKQSAISSLRRLEQNPKLPISLALNVNVDKSVDLAESLFKSLSSIFIDSNYLDILNVEELETLLNKLEEVESLDTYYISKFMVYAVPKIPYSVFNLILVRIEAKATKDDFQYDALPYGTYNHENFLHYLCNTEDYKDMLRLIRDLWFICELQIDFFVEDKQNPISWYFIICKLFCYFFNELNLISTLYFILRSSDESQISTFSQLEELYKMLYKEMSLTYIEKLNNQSVLDITPESIELLNEWIQTKDATKIEATSKLIINFHSGFISDHLDFIANLLEQAYEVNDRCYEVVQKNLLCIDPLKVRVGIPGEPFPEDIALRDEATAIAKRFPKGTPVRKFFDSLIKSVNSDIATFKQIFDEDEY
ncbi:MAG: SMEK domain-containing protein [Spirulina sp.]